MTVGAPEQLGDPSGHSGMPDGIQRGDGCLTHGGIFVTEQAQQRLERSRVTDTGEGSGNRY